VNHFVIVATLAAILQWCRL